MIKLSTGQLHALQTISRQFPEFVELLEDWKAQELNALPYATNNLDVIRGRVQTLVELTRELKPR